APSAQSVRREPIDPYIARPAVAGDDHVAEIFELRILRMRQVTRLRRDDLRLRAVRVVEKLIRLMRADVGQDAAVARLIEEPCRAIRRVHSMRRQVHRLNDASDRALSNQLARIDSRTYLEPFRVHDRELAFRFLDGAPDVRELLRSEEHTSELQSRENLV